MYFKSLKNLKTEKFWNFEFTEFQNGKSLGRIINLESMMSPNCIETKFQKTLKLCRM